MHSIKNSKCWECKQEKENLICFDGLESWQDNAEICLDCLVSAQHRLHLTAFGVGTQAVNPLQSSLIVEVPPAKVGGG